MKKLSIEYVKDEFDKKGWKLISKEYLGSQVPLNCICPEGHETTITWNNLQREQGCKYCAGNTKYNYDDVVQKFKDRGCELLEETYYNNFQLLTYRCLCGNISKIRFLDLLRGHYCKKCSGVRISQKLQLSLSEAVETCNNNGCQLMEMFIHNKRTRIKFICRCGEMWEAYYSNFTKYPNCRKCGIAKKSGVNCYLWNPNRETVALNKKYQKACGRILRRALEATGQQKTDHTYMLLGYMGKQLQEHIQNHSKYRPKEEFHIDHVFPIKAFIDHGIFDLKVINALDNLQPLSGTENESKADNYNIDEFKEWLKQKKLSKF